MVNSHGAAPRRLRWGLPLRLPGRRDPLVPTGGPEGAWGGGPWGGWTPPCGDGAGLGGSEGAKAVTLSCPPDLGCPRVLARPSIRRCPQPEAVGFGRWVLQRVAQNVAAAATSLPASVSPAPPTSKIPRHPPKDPAANSPAAPGAGIPAGAAAFP